MPTKKCEYNGCQERIEEWQRVCKAHYHQEKVAEKNGNGNSVPQAQSEMVQCNVRNAKVEIIKALIAAHPTFNKENVINQAREYFKLLG